MMPTANHVAWAIVAAARETMEDPEQCVLRAPGLNCRHYALHALATVFPEADRARLAFLVGSPGGPSGFYANSVSQKFKKWLGGPREGKRLARWWDEAAFERVICAVREVTPITDADPEGRAHQPRPLIKLTAAPGRIIEPFRPAAVPGKRKLQDMLREAVQNTARLPVGE